MPRLTTMMQKNGSAIPTFNIEDTVGLGGKNDFGDVLLVKSLLFLAGCDLTVSKGGSVAMVESYRSENDKLDNVRERAIGGHVENCISFIQQYQMKNLNKLLIKKVDGLVHPADYEGRKLDLSGAKPLMMITLLALQCKQKVESQPGAGFSWIELIYNINPQLRAYSS